MNQVLWLHKTAEALAVCSLNVITWAWCIQALIEIHTLDISMIALLAAFGDFGSGVDAKTTHGLIRQQ